MLLTQNFLPYNNNSLAALLGHMSHLGGEQIPRQPRKVVARSPHILHIFPTPTEKSYQSEHTLVTITIPNLVPRPSTPRFHLAAIFLHSCEIKFGCGRPGYEVTNTLHVVKTCNPITIAFDIILLCFRIMPLRQYQHTY